VELSPAEQSELIAVLASIQVGEDDELRAELIRKIDVTTSANWVSLDDLQKRWAN
jgi:hypothetical protein